MCDDDVDKTKYLITIGEPNRDGVMADTLTESLIFIGRMIEKLSKDNNFIGKSIYITQYQFDIISKTYIRREDLYFEKYLIEE
jgi:hypothetical protein